MLFLINMILVAHKPPNSNSPKIWLKVLPLCSEPVTEVENAACLLCFGFAALFHKLVNIKYFPKSGTQGSSQQDWESFHHQGLQIGDWVWIWHSLYLCIKYYFIHFLYISLFKQGLEWHFSGCPMFSTQEMKSWTDWQIVSGLVHNVALIECSDFAFCIECVLSLVEKFLFFFLINFVSFVALKKIPVSNDFYDISSRPAQY